MTKYKPLFAYTLKSLINVINAIGDEHGFNDEQRQELITRVDSKLREIEPHYEEKLRAKDSVPKMPVSDPIQTQT